MSNSKINFIVWVVTASVFFFVGRASAMEDDPDDDVTWTFEKNIVVIGQDLATFTCPDGTEYQISIDDLETMDLEQSKFFLRAIFGALNKEGLEGVCSDPPDSVEAFRVVE